jgi:alpha-ketoglutarate-dependent taurine dioxygenase
MQASQSQLPDDYSGVKIRTLSAKERFARISRSEIPMVIEPSGSSDLSSLRTFLDSHSDQILRDIGIFGAVLVRGFAVRTDSDFESAVLSVRGMRGMSGALMSESGRDLVDGTRFVLHTNSKYKTGGTLLFGGFHSENYYSPDVPKYISFCCHRPCRIGGETGLVHMPAVYSELPDEIRARLETQACRVETWPIQNVADRYGMRLEQLIEFCKAVGLPLTPTQDPQFIHMYKPSVFDYASSEQATLALNLNLAIPGLSAALRPYFMPDYSGIRWAGWRFGRRYPLLMDLSKSYNPVKTLREARYQKKQKRTGQAAPPVPPDKVGSLFKPEDVHAIAASMRKHFVSFAWRRGDVLLVDNMQMAHTGMPGMGNRLVRAMICNPVPMVYEAGGPGRCRIRDVDADYKTLFARLPSK